MFTGKSDAAKRIAATSAFDSDNLQEAKAKSDEAMALMKEAAKLAPSESMLKMAKDRCDELMRNLLDSYKQNYETIAKEGAKDLQQLDSGKTHGAIDSAKALSEKGNYEEANKILSDSLNELSVALNKMLANRHIS